MTKGKFIELVYLKINGGQLNDSSSVDRRDIRTYVPAAVNYVITAQYNINLQVEGNRDMSSIFYGYFANLTILTDTARHNWKYVVLPKATIPLPRNQGIRAVEDGCGYNLKPLSDNAFKTIAHWLKTLTGDKYYRLEGNRIYLFGMPPVMTVLPGLSMIVDSDALADTDELPIPAGQEGKAIDITFEFISGERQLPADRKSDERDIN